jgi:hypothetical protein
MASIAPADLRRGNRVRHDESRNTRDHIGEAAGMKCHVLQKSIPLTLLLLILGEGGRKGIRQVDWELDFAPFEGRSACAGKPVAVERKRLAEEPNVISSAPTLVVGKSVRC